MNNKYGKIVFEDGNEIELTKKVIEIGRSNTCFIILKVYIYYLLKHPSVSKEHSLIHFDNEGKA